MRPTLERCYPNSREALGDSGADGLRKPGRLEFYLKANPLLQKQQLSYWPWHKYKDQTHFWESVATPSGHGTWEKLSSPFQMTLFSPFLDANVYLV